MTDDEPGAEPTAEGSTDTDETSASSAESAAADSQDVTVNELVENAVAAFEDRHDLPQKELDEPRYDTCGAKTKSDDSVGEHCRMPAGYGTDNDEGRCKYHGGATPTKEQDPEAGVGQGDQWGNGNAEEHGLFADKKKWYMRKDRETKKAIHQLHRRWLKYANRPEVAAPLLWDAAINEFRLGQAEAYFEDEDLLTEVTVDYDQEKGEKITKRDEHPALMPRSRMQRDTIKILKETGVLGGESAGGGGTGSLADAIAKVMADDDDDDGVVDVDAEVRDA